MHKLNANPKMLFLSWFYWQNYRHSTHQLSQHLLALINLPLFFPKFPLHCCSVNAHQKRSQKCQMKQGKWDLCQGVSGRFRQVFKSLCISHRKLIPSLKLHCQIRAGAGHCGTFHCSETWKGNVWSPVWVFGICTPTGARNCQLTPVLAVPSPLTPTNSTAKAFPGATSPSGGHSLLGHICHSLPREPPILLITAISVTGFDSPLAAFRVLIFRSSFTGSRQQS